MFGDFRRRLFGLPAGDEREAALETESSTGRPTAREPMARVSEMSDAPAAAEVHIELTSIGDDVDRAAAHAAAALAAAAAAADAGDGFARASSPEHAQSRRLSPLRSPSTRARPRVPIGSSSAWLRTRDEVEAALTARAVDIPAGYRSFWSIEYDGFEDEEAAINASFERAIHEVKEISKNVAIGGGAHNMSRKGGLYPAIKGKAKGKSDEQDAGAGSHGARRRLVCSSAGRPTSSQVADVDALGGDDDDDDDNAGGAVKRRVRCSRKTECKHKVWLEHVAGGVMIMELSSFEHNHDLATTRAEKAAAAETRDDIPDTVFEEASIWSARIPLPLVVETLREKYTVDGKVPDWSVKDFGNLLQPTSSEKMLDTTNFIANLAELGVEGGSRACCALAGTRASCAFPSPCTRPPIL